MMEPLCYWSNHVTEPNCLCVCDEGFDLYGSCLWKNPVERGEHTLCSSQVFRWRLALVKQWLFVLILW